MRAVVAIIALLLSVGNAHAALKCVATMCADGRQVRCCGSGCCPGAKKSGGSGYDNMFMNQMWNMVLSNQQRYNQQAARNLLMRREAAARNAAAAEQALLQRKQQRLEAERRALQERIHVLKSMKGVQLSEGPLKMKAIGASPQGKANPWCFENPPKSDCDAYWERRCGDGSRKCEVVDVPKDRDYWFDAEIGQVTGPVFVKRGSNKWIKLDQGEKLHGGDVIRTGNGGAVNLTTFDYYFESYTSVGANSEFTVQEIKTSYFGRSARYIKNGLVRFKVRCTQKGIATCLGKPEWRVHTPELTAAVRGTTFQIAVAGNGLSSTLLHEGGIEASAAENKKPTEEWYTAAKDDIGKSAAHMQTAEDGRAIRLGDNSVAVIAPESLLSTAGECRIEDGSVLISYTGKKGAKGAICRTPRGVVSALESDAVFLLSVAQEGLPLLRVYSGKVLLTVKKK